MIDMPTAISSPSTGRVVSDRAAPSRGAPDWTPYVIAGQAFIVLFMIVEFGALIPPAIFSTVIAFFGFGVALIAPKGKVMRAPVSMPILLYVTWYLMSRAWTFQPVWWMRIARRELPLTVAMVLVVSVLPLRAIVNAILASLYAGIAMTVFALVTRPGTAAQHVYPGTRQPSLPGWHGMFDHKTGMSLFLLIGLITLLNFERSRARATVGTIAIVVLIIGSQSSTGLTALIFVVGFHVWLRSYVASRHRRDSIYPLVSAVVGLTGVLLMWVYLPTLVESRGKDLTFSGRTLIWSASLDAIGDRPWVGYGVGGVFREMTADPTAAMIRQIGFTAFHAHSSVIQLLLDLGVIGLGLFVVAYLSTVIGAVRAVRYVPSVACWALLILGVQFVYSLSEVASWGPWLPLMAAISVLTARAARDDLPDEPVVRPPLPSGRSVPVPA